MLQGEIELQPVHVRIWDFGGQDLYHQTHRLFFESGAIYVVAWDPFEADREDHNEGNFYTDKKRPISYWIDQIRSVDTQARILIVRTKADLDGKRPDPDWKSLLTRHQRAIEDGLIKFVKLSSSDRTGRFRDQHAYLLNWLADAVKRLLGEPAKRAIGAGRLAVRNQIEHWQQQNDMVLEKRDQDPSCTEPIPTLGSAEPSLTIWWRDIAREPTTQSTHRLS